MNASLASTARTLAVDYPPAWAMPNACLWYSLPDRDIAELLRVPCLSTLRTLRGIYADRLAAIEDGTHYDRGDFGRHIGIDSYYNARNKDNKSTKFNLDRCEAYHKLWWVDVFIAVHTR